MSKKKITTNAAAEDTALPEPEEPGKTIDIINDVCGPLALFESFLDRVTGNGFNSNSHGDDRGAPTHDEMAALEGGRIVLERAIADLHRIHNDLDVHHQMLSFKVGVR